MLPKLRSSDAPVWSKKCEVNLRFLLRAGQMVSTQPWSMRPKLTVSRQSPPPTSWGLPPTCIDCAASSAAPHETSDQPPCRKIDPESTIAHTHLASLLTCFVLPFILNSKKKEGRVRSGRCPAPKEKKGASWWDLPSQKMSV